MNCSKTPAGRRYNRRYWPAIAVQVITTLSVAWVFKHYHPRGFTMYLLAVLPALPILGVIAIFGVYMAEEQDEFVRTVLMQSSLWATGVVLAFATFWGFLETYTPVGRFASYWIFFAWCVAFGLIEPLVRRRYR